MVSLGSCFSMWSCAVRLIRRPVSREGQRLKNGGFSCVLPFARLPNAERRLCIASDVWEWSSVMRSLGCSIAYSWSVLVRSVSTAAMKASSSSREWNLVALHDATCSTLPSNRPASTSVSGRNWMTKARLYCHWSISNRCDWPSGRLDESEKFVLSPVTHNLGEGAS